MEHFLTVEAVAELLHVHTRTIRRYIKEKRLPARKVGGQWRITPDDLKKFTGVDGWENIVNPPHVNPEERSYSASGRAGIQVSAVVDVAVASKEEALRLSSTILAAMNSREKSKPARCDYLFDEEEGLAQFILRGEPRFIRTMLKMFEIAADQDE